MRMSNMAIIRGNNMRPLSLVIVACLLSGCFLGDSVMRISGRIQSESGMALSDCVAGIRWVGQGNPTPWGFADDKAVWFFQRSFVAPFRRDEEFILLVSCPGYSEVYRSDPFSPMEAGELYPESYDLGILIIKGGERSSGSQDYPALPEYNFPHLIN